MSGGGRGMSWVVVVCWFTLTATRAEDDVRNPPLILKPDAFEQKFYSKGNDVTLQCLAEGDPAPTYEWLWNAHLISSGKQRVSFDVMSGTLTIRGITEEEDGFYSCRAQTRFPSGLAARSLSNRVEVRVARRTSEFPEGTQVVTVAVGEYVALECLGFPTHYGKSSYKWFTDVDDENKEVIEDDRVFVDSNGTLHFTYALVSDQHPRYKCALSMVASGGITISPSATDLRVTAGSIPEVKPVLRFPKSSGITVTFQRNSPARLECVFSGYQNAPGLEAPTITWYDNAGNKMTTDSSGGGGGAGDGGGGDCQTVVGGGGGRALELCALQEADEQAYVCEASNSLGTSSATVFLNVTSRPVMERPLDSMTVPQGRDAVLHCLARSLAGEFPPETPRWYRNADPGFNNNYDPHKYSWNQAKTQLTVRAVQKDTDIACYQCEVSNSEGSTFSDACLNVILPIVITTKPPPVQTIRLDRDDDSDDNNDAGDDRLVRLTVVATSDKQYPVTYKWLFGTQEYEAGSAPPHVTYDVSSRSAYINTSGLTTTQLREVAGEYSRVVSHQYQTVVVNFTVVLEEDVRVLPVAVMGGTQPWVLAVTVALILLLLLVILVCVIVVVRRKAQEGEYEVRDKEVDAGLDPDQEMKDHAFKELTLAKGDWAPSRHLSTLGLTTLADSAIADSDNDSFTSLDYNDDAPAFNEDGSFIGVYTPKAKHSSNNNNNYSSQKTDDTSMKMIV